MSNTLVFDIETVPLPDDQYTKLQLEYIEKRLASRLQKDPTIEPDAERRKLKALDPLTSRIACIGLYYPDAGIAQVLMEEDEAAMLQQFWQILAGFTGQFISFNGIKFDCPYIIRRSMYHQVEPTNRDFLKYTAYNPLPDHFDVMLQISGRDGYISLEHACQFLSVASPKDGDVAADGVATAYAAGEWDKIKKYCERDLIATSQLYLKVKQYLTSK